MRTLSAVVSVLILAACGSAPRDVSSTPASVSLSPSPSPSASATSTDTGPGLRVFVDERGVSVEVASTERIIPLDGDVAEIVFALGMGDRVVATDLSATYPPEADALPQIGYQRALNTEPILEFDPTLVIGTDIAGPPAVIDELERVGVAVAIVPTPDDATGPATKIRAIAELLGVAERGEELAAIVEREIAAVAPLAPDSPEVPPLRVAMLYLRGESTQLIFGEGTSIDWLIEATGSVNVAIEMGVVDTADISAEALIVAAPDVLIVTEDGLASVGGIEGLLSMPAIAGTPAAAHRAVLAYDTQLMLGNGPRTGEFLANLVANLGDIMTRLSAERDDTNKETP